MWEKHAILIASLNHLFTAYQLLIHYDTFRQTPILKPPCMLLRISSLPCKGEVWCTNMMAFNQRGFLLNKRLAAIYQNNWDVIHWRYNQNCFFFKAVHPWTIYFPFYILLFSKHWWCNGSNIWTISLTFPMAIYWYLWRDYISMFLCFLFF